MALRIKSFGLSKLPMTLIFGKYFCFLACRAYTSSLLQKAWLAKVNSTCLPVIFSPLQHLKGTADNQFLRQ